MLSSLLMHARLFALVLAAFAATSSASASTLTLNGAGALLLSGATTNTLRVLAAPSTSSLLKTGAGTVTFASTSMPIQAGTFQITNATVNTTAAGSLTLSGSSSSTGNLVINASNVGTVTTGNINVGGTVNLGLATVTKIGAGTLTLSGNSSYTGATTVNINALTSGTSPASLTINSPTFQSGRLTLTSGTIASGAGTLNLVTNSAGATMTLPVQVLNGQLANLGTSIQFSGNFQLVVFSGGVTNIITFPGIGLPITPTIPDYGVPTDAVPVATGNATVLSNAQASVRGSYLEASFTGCTLVLQVEFGPGTSYGSIQTVSFDQLGYRNYQGAFATVLDGLQPATAYHFRTKATATRTVPGGGVVTEILYGADHIFTTPAATEGGPVWLTGAAATFTPFSLGNRGVINLAGGLPYLPSFVSFGQGASGTVTANGSVLTYTPGSGFLTEDTVRVRIVYAGLPVATAANDPGSATALVMDVRIRKITLPVAVTGAATVNSNTQAQTNGTFAANGPGGRASFEYGVTANYGMEKLPLTLISGGGEVTAVPTVVLTGLQPGTTYHYRARLTNSLGTALGNDATFTTPPFVDAGTLTLHSGAVTFDGIARIAAPMLGTTAALSSAISGANVVFNPGDSPLVGIVTQGGHGSVHTSGNLITYTPGPDYEGSDQFTYEVKSSFFVLSSFTSQSLARFPFLVRVNVQSSFSLEPTSVGKGGTVPGTAFTFAAIGTAEAGAFSGTLRTGTANLPAIFAADGTVKVKVGDGAPGLAGSSLLKLGTPSGQAALATLKPGPGAVTTLNDTVLLGGLDGTPRIAARKGQPFSNAAGLRIKSFGAFDGNGSVIFFRAIVQGGAVTEATDSALCAALPDGRVRLLVREGNGIASIATLVGLPGTLAEGRWRAGTDQLGVRLTFSDGAQLISIVRVPLSTPEEWTVVHDIAPGVWERVPETDLARVLDYTSDLTLGIPGFGAGGAAYRLTSRIGRGGITAANNVALLSGPNTVLARKSGLAPLAANTTAEGVVFQDFDDPIVGGAGRIAFAATLRGPGVTPANSRGLWFTTNGLIPRLVARARDAAPGGGQFATFTSLVLPDGPTGGPFFTATLVPGSAEGITAGSNSGLWAMDRDGVVQLLLRTGQPLRVSGELKTVVSFAALAPAPGSIGAAHGYDDAGHLSALATFDDGSVSILKFFVP